MENTQLLNKERILMRILCVLLAVLLLLVCIGIGLYNKFSTIREGYVSIVDRAQTANAEPTAPPPTPDPFSLALDTSKDYYVEGELQDVPIYSQKQIDRFIFSMLVVVQNGSLTTENPQTDMMFIVSYSQIKQQFTVISLMRDMLVPMGEYGWQRLNAAYAYGGIGMLINTINDVFELDIQNYVYIGTDELQKLADLIGGIPVDLTEAEAQHINQTCGSSLSSGPNMLTGEQAIANLRDRTSDGTGDFGRSSRQLRMVESTFNTLQENNDRSQMGPLFASIFRSIRTNIEYDTLAGIGYEVCVADDLSFVTARVPFDESYTETSMDGAFALIPEVEKNKILIRQALYSKE